MNIKESGSSFWPFGRRKNRETSRKIIAERLYLNRLGSGRSGNQDTDWFKAVRIDNSPLRKLLFHLNQPLIHLEKRTIEPTVKWIDRADLFRIVEKLSPTIEALGVIAIPMVLFFAAQGYDKTLRNQEQEQLRQQAVLDYLSQFSEILLNVEGDLQDIQNQRVRTLMAATTATLLRDPNLDGDRRSQVVEFLSQMSLIQSEPEDGGPATAPVISLQDTDLSQADLGQADLYHANLHKTNLRSASLISANLRYADLSYGDLRDAELNSAFLLHANLSNVKFQGADLSNATLTSSDLRRSNFSNADLRDTDFQDANLQYADFRKAINLTEAQLKVGILCETRFPNGMALDPRRDCEVVEDQSSRPLHSALHEVTH
ncbi:MAG: pentapeptide repeat-containing protein [Cyanobacteria bacterium P01_D01_bin.14]